MKAQTLKESTTELTTKEVGEVFDTLNRLLSEKFGLTISFPNFQDLLHNHEKNSNS